MVSEDVKERRRGHAYSQLDLGGEEIELNTESLLGRSVQVDKGGRDNSLLTLDGPHDFVSELSAGIGHT